MKHYIFEEPCKENSNGRMPIVSCAAKSKSDGIKRLICIMETRAKHFTSPITHEAWLKRVKVLKGYQKRGKLEKNYFIRKVEDETLQT